ncbi:tRNA (uridine(54)-C5)-methyltransferase TrmA [Planctobacterium marinum]|uniref:tRNA (uridine(54)-C5)-methyltransferase TrmA n=1 Tax=Planctobacterium marinum TaxID=1631968 RepID=UPI001E446C87|nr:tRNA (uridine(54)-C5)-methyltransferase TrmA [Planctobacterium marinum]MCC2607883.1 tRNA (uridine(54)-C5)-methyltransferase TrmA [Planctobacterium marinum]
MQQIPSDPDVYQTQLLEKQKRLSELFSPFFDGELAVFESPLQHYRSRAEFRVWHENDDLYHIMFDQNTKEKYRVDQFPVAIETINELMVSLLLPIRENPILRRKLFQIDYLSGLSGDTVISLLYHRQLDESWEAEIAKLKAKLSTAHQVNFVGRAKKQKLIKDQDFITESLKVFDNEYQFMHVENSFTQPNPYVNQSMIEWCIDNTRDRKSGDLLEFYCGAGNFSIPLAQNFRKVVGTEISRTSVAAANHNIKLNGVDNVFIARMSSEEFTQYYQTGEGKKRLEGAGLEDLAISTVLVDPPRAGIDDDTLELIRAYDEIIYISCNPETLIENVTTLSSSHSVEELALFDQFPYTHHIESGVILRKK